MHAGPLKYTLVHLIPAATVAGLLLGGGWVWMTAAIVFGLVPLGELLLRGDTANPTAEQVAARSNDRRYDVVLYAAVPVQIITVTLLVVLVSQGTLAGLELVGAIVAVGLGCGGLGINIGHELGHRSKVGEQRLAKILLATSLYAHFFIEHNRGHHARIGTPEDPASARRGEWLYPFWVRSIVGGWLSAWRLEAKRLRSRGHSLVSWHNEMLRLQLLQAALVGAVALLAGPAAAGAFIAAALIGALLLETVNYLEHYGLRRQRTARGSWETVRPSHSWNSNHTLGRLLLFELTRHSDHHAHPKRKYPALRHFDEAPQLPTGYPGMILVALVPPLFFALMHPRLECAGAATPANATT